MDYVMGSRGAETTLPLSGRLYLISALSITSGAATSLMLPFSLA